MAIERIFISPSHFQFYISDSTLPEAPAFGEDMKVETNGLSLIVPCQSSQEGETELIVGTYDSVPKDAFHVFDGSIPTASGILLFSDIELNELLSYPVASPHTRLRLWTNHLREPSRVVVAVG